MMWFLKIVKTVCIHTTHTIQVQNQSFIDLDINAWYIFVNQKLDIKCILGKKKKKSKNFELNYFRYSKCIFALIVISF